jgi:predicted DNA-binding protein YlxM (UPF0122 family)
MNKQEQAIILKEMRRLYLKKEWTLQQIADYYNVSKTTVYNRFTKNGITLQRKRRRPEKKILDRKVLTKLYEKEKLSILKVAARLEVSCPTVVKKLKRHGIEIRLQGDIKYKYPAIKKLELGEKLTVPRPPVKQPHRTFYYHAETAGIKISVKTIDNETLQITRIE